MPSSNSPTADRAATVTVLVDPRRALGRVSPEVFGWQHGEVGDPIFRGLWAELLANRKFGGHDESMEHARRHLWRTGAEREDRAPRPAATVIAIIRAEVFHQYTGENPVPPDFGVVNPWYATGDGPHAYFTHDNTTYFTGGQSQRVELHEDDGTWHGVAQAGLRIAADRSYAVRLVARAEGLAGLRVRLVDVASGSELAAADLDRPGAEWSEATATLRSDRTCENAAFHIEARGKGTLWCGAASLMQSDAVDGLRRDVLDAVAALRPAIIRWGGNTTQFYRWRQGVGPRDRRAPFMDAWDSLLSHDFGTHEYIRYCRLVGAEPLICANAGDAPDEAAEWVEYCNAPADRGLGRLRAENGSPEPFAVKLWSLGNEVYGNWVVGHCDPETYGRRARRMGEAMRRVDPDVRLLLVGSWLDREWNRRMLREAAPIGDYLSLHWYPTVTTRVGAAENASPQLEEADEAAAYADVVDATRLFEQRLDEIREDVAAVRPETPLPVALDEWSLMLSVIGPRPESQRWGRVKDMRDALTVSSVFARIFRRPDLIGLSTYTRLHRYGLYTHQGGVFASPDVLAIALLRERMQPVAVAADVRESTPGSAEPLDVAASASDDGGAVAICMVNRDPRRAITVTLELEGARVRDVEVRRVAGRSYVDANTLEDPRAITVQTFAATPGAPLELPPASVSVVSLRAG